MTLDIGKKHFERCIPIGKKNCISGLNKIFKISLYKILIKLYNAIGHGTNSLSRLFLSVVTLLFRAVIDHVYCFIEFAKFIIHYQCQRNI